MSQSTDLRRLPAVTALVAFLAVVLTAPAAAAAEARGPEGTSSASTAVEEGTPEHGPSASRADGVDDGPSEGDRSAEPETPAKRARSGLARDDSSAASPGRASGDEGSGTPSDSRRAPRTRSRSSQIPRPERSGDAVGDDLDGLGESIRRDVRSRTDGIRDRVLRRTEQVRRRAAGSGRRDSGRERGTEAGDGDGAEVSVSWSDGDQVTLLRGGHHYRVGARVIVSGHEPLRSPGRFAMLQLLSGGRWVDLVGTRTGEDGRFDLVWTPQRPGRYQLRVRPRRRSVFEPSRVRWVFVYRRAVASWYGPGFYGNRTACGQTFTSRLMGVAHKSLPCGTLVRIRYNRRSRTVPVVDRGPFVHGREYDLTEALRNYLRFDGVDRVWATS